MHDSRRDPVGGVEEESWHRRRWKRERWGLVAGKCKGRCREGALGGASMKDLLEETCV